jgi:hypothetical protein
MLAHDWCMLSLMAACNSDDALLATGAKQGCEVLTGMGL